MDQSFAARPFRFDTEFEVRPVHLDEDGADSLAAAALRAELDVMRADRDKAVADAHARGLEEGAARARADRDEALLAATDALHAAWEDFAHARDAIVEQVREQGAMLALAIGQQLAGHAMHLAPAQAIDDALGRALALVARGQEIIVTVHPDLVTDMETRVAARQAGDRRKLVVLVEGAGDIAPGDARLRWDGGGMTLNAADRHAAVLAELAAVLPTA